MQTPQSPRRKLGYGVALAGSGFSIISFFAFPFYYSCYFIFCESFSLFQALSKGAAIIIWLSLVFAAIVCIVALFPILRLSSPALGGAISLIVLGLIGTGSFLFLIIAVSNTPNDSVAFGAWVCFFGMIVATIGGIAAIIDRPR